MPQPAPGSSFLDKQTLTGIAPCLIWRNPEVESTAEIDLAQRSRRSATACGFEAVLLSPDDQFAARQILDLSLNSCLILEAGAWFVAPQRALAPPSSASGRPVCAIGRTRRLPSDAVTESGVAPSGRSHSPATLIESEPDVFRLASEQLPQCCGLDRSGSVRWKTLLQQTGSFRTALRELLRDPTLRLVPFAPLDVSYDSFPRVLQVVTSLQRGGAERITLELAGELERQGVFAPVATLGNPTRGAYRGPRVHLDLARHAPQREQRVPALDRAALRLGIDVIHAHLIDRTDAAALTQAGWPLIMTIHNTRAGWPQGLADLQSKDATLLAGCAQQVEAELVEAELPVVVRTVWNGIAPAAFCALADGAARRAAWRAAHSVPLDALVLAAVANPRPQKRMHLLPAVTVAVEQELLRRGDRRSVYLVLAGEASRASPVAEGCVAQIEREIDRLGLKTSVRWLGGVEDVREVYEAADALVSTSAHEGLSLAQMEALAAGLSLIVTDVGGTREMAEKCPALALVDPAATAETFASLLVDHLVTRGILPARSCPRNCRGLPESVTSAGPPSDFTPNPIPARTCELPRDFHLATMARRYRNLYPRVIAVAGPRPRGRGLWLVTNNFSMGGAQSSARRLLGELHRRGVPVRAAVLQEQPEYPTPGRRDLERQGIRVVALPVAGTIDAAEAVGEFLRAMDRDLPRAVLFWNALAEYKVLIADALWDVPIFDVSPGEMYFTSLARYLTNPRAGLPYRTAREYGARLTAAIVKFAAEQPRAAETLGTRVHVIPNGVPIPECHQEPTARDSTHRVFIIGTAARISPQKKLEELLAAVRIARHRMQPFVLRIAGGVETGAEDYARTLRQAAEGLPVEWMGELPDTQEFLQRLDLFAMISAPAGCPNATLEALAAGLPVIATDVGGAGEQVITGETGLLVPEGDPEALATGIQRMADSPALRHRLAQQGAQHVRQNFSMARMADEYCRICLGDDAVVRPGTPR